MSDATYVSRGGQKLAHALREFAVDVRGLVCADLGCSTGGFTDCLLQHGASKVFAVDTAYGELAWKLRKDPRVVVMERSNALHATPPEQVDVVVVDLGWTTQRQLVPVALGWLKGGDRPESSGERRGPCIITLIKPHYEAKHTALAAEAARRRGILPDELAEQVMRTVVDELPALGVRVAGLTRSPLRGGSKADGNMEWLAELEAVRHASRGTD
ncbi:MAG: Hemolysin A [Phycisphaerales bacterium]|nr:Hemolysin A [Phycisphaerales bacterium]